MKELGQDSVHQVVPERTEDTTRSWGAVAAEVRHQLVGTPLVTK